MIKEIKMPSAGQTTDEALIAKWTVNIGDKVKRGDVLVEAETDKAVLPVESYAEGIVLDILVPEGESVDAGTVLCIVGSEADRNSYQRAADETKPSDGQAAAFEEDDEEYQPIFAKKTSPSVSQAEERTETSTQTEKPVYPAMPSAKKLAKEQGVRLEALCPSNGMFIKKKDVVDALQKACRFPDTAPDTEYTEKRLAGIRQVIAKTMHDSLNAMAQLTHHASFDASALFHFKEEIKAAAIQGIGSSHITVTDMLVFAVARVLIRYPDLNANLQGDLLRSFRHVHMGVAVDTPRGLLVPTVSYADEKSLSEISSEIRGLVEACRDGSIRPEQMSGGSFTITNLGTLGVEYFTPVINPPQTGILGVGCLTERARKINGVVDTYPAMGLSLTYDHRALDGAPASQFLKELCQVLEHFPVLFVS